MYKRMSPECGPVSAKAGGLYVASTLVKHDAERRGFNDALMLDYRNYVAESSTSNVFFVINNQIHTPIADCFLNGITRQTIIELSKKLGYKVIERHIKLDELASATDAFLTGTAAELTKIASVTSRDMKIVYKFKESKISSHLLQEYQNLVK
jgi:branched-chain amino acid aminotransferase